MEGLPRQGADAVFRSCLPGPLDSLPPADAFGAFLHVYATVPAVDGALPREADGDALLFQFGTHDWGEGERFDLNLTRQVVYPDGEDVAIHQLSLSLMFEPNPPLTALGGEEHWFFADPGSGEFGDLSAFRAFVLDHAALHAVAGRTAVVELGWGPV